MMNHSTIIARAAVLVLSAALARRVPPEYAAFWPLGAAVAAGLTWHHIRWPALLTFLGGLVGLAAHYSGGNRQQFYANIKTFAVLIIVLVGVYVMAHASCSHHGDSRRR